jgi:hypothetical protein
MKKKVNSYESACVALGKQPVTDWGDDTTDEIAYKKLKTIIEALNEGWKADYTNGNERKWFPWFNVSLSGFAFGDTLCECSAPLAGCAARLCLKSSDLAEYAGKTFLKLWEDFIL